MFVDEKSNSVFLIGCYGEYGITKSTEKLDFDENWFWESTTDLFEYLNDSAAIASKKQTNSLDTSQEDGQTMEIFLLFII